MVKNIKNHMNWPTAFNTVFVVWNQMPSSKHSEQGMTKHSLFPALQRFEIQSIEWMLIQRLYIRFCCDF